MPDPQTFTFEDDGAVPNHPRFPALVYPRAFAAGTTPGEVVAHFAQHGWTGAWTGGKIFPFHHFHTTAHEVLAITSGQTRLILGGPQGEELDVQAGDVLVLPAGTGHCRTGPADDLAVVGAYADGRDWDLLRGDPAEHDAAVARIVTVPAPQQDPVTGEPIWR